MNPLLLQTHDLTEAQIETLVRHFYGKVRSDHVLGPIFEKRIANDWEPHLLRMMDFWSSVMLRTGRFKGQPLQKHHAITELEPEHFAHWLTLFESSAREVLSDELASAFVARATMIAESFKMGIFPPHGIARAV